MFPVNSIVIDTSNNWSLSDGGSLEAIEKWDKFVLGEQNDVIKTRKLCVSLNLIDRQTLFIFIANYVSRTRQISNFWRNVSTYM